jgi:type VI secretion system protein ImpM
VSGPVVGAVSGILQTPAIAGFFGKVTSHGDFVTRRLPAGFVAAWDGWLQAGLQGSRDLLGQEWLATYMSSPIWRFMLAPGVCNSHAWAGVVMPSVDRVGRHFPLTIAVSAPPSLPMMAWLAASGHWYARLEELALSSLEANFLLDEFDAAVAALQGPVGGAGSARQKPGTRFALAGVDDLAAQRDAVERNLAAAALARHSLWWTDGSDLVAPSLLACPGLPHPKQFAGMLDGKWTQRDWFMAG